MAVDNSEIIDLIGIDNKTGAIILTISDHLDWKDIDSHLVVLQNKINRYLSFIESGEIYESYPSAKGRSLIIKVITKYSLPKEGIAFMDGAKKIVKEAGFMLESGLLEHQ